MSRSVRGILPLAPLCVLICGCSMFGDSAWNGAHTSVGAGLQQVALSGSIDTTTPIGKGGSVTTAFDLEDDAGQDEEQSALYAAAQLGIAPLELRVSGFEYANEASGTFTGELLGTTFSGPVETDFDLSAYKLTMGLDVLNLERLRVGAIVGATVMDLDFLIASTTVPDASENLDEMVPAPVAGVRADLKVIDGVRVGGEFTMLPIDEVEGFEVSFIDWELGIHVEPLPYLEVFGLYREIRLELDGDIDGNDAALDIGLRGPVIGVAITF